VLENLKGMKRFGQRGFVFPREKAGRPFNLQVLGHALRKG
jgi:hypothetical protein